jgi:hypothetical protein
VMGIPDDVSTRICIVFFPSDYTSITVFTWVSRGQSGEMADEVLLSPRFNDTYAGRSDEKPPSPFNCASARFRPSLPERSWLPGFRY